MTAALVEYSGSSSEEDEKDECPSFVTCGKRKLELEGDGSSSAPVTKLTKLRPRPCLPLPCTIQEMFQDKERTSKQTDDSSDHGGRIRSFPHEEGNWASYVYVPVFPDERLSVFLGQLLTCLQPLNFQTMDELHLTLSRTVSIRHHWIPPLAESLKDKFAELESCLCDVTFIKFYTNDEKTRTFVSLQVEMEGTLLKEYVSAVDSCFSDFNLPHYYKDPSFHISLLWSVGDVTSQISDKTRQKIQTITQDFFISNTDLSILDVNEVCLRTGNKMFSFKLAAP